ncbi:hypothetical protein MTsPCn9_09540 [Croceitalea sp. MTPC9]|uniref:hypothetical protein n=1 Tax=unclassified Croceitalea TaxID=2632280 RepID=UPI002B3BEC3C|nr:hypothetical protein MTsPCn6_27700 [Croceitalea sp. MTPC6]GMN16018.1 hypothetical protein MTsPCn9_09540 [Croceitalea sp. MTPC9]
MKLILIAIIILTSSCKNQKSLAEADIKQDNELTLLVQDSYFFTDTMETSIVRDEKTLKSFFSRVNRTRKPGIPLPKINFEEEIALVVCMGEQKTSAMPFLKLLKDDDQEIKIAIEMKNKSKKEDKVVSYPFCVYKMSISENKIVFKLL